MSVETKQIRLKLTENKQVLAALRKNKSLRDIKGVETYVSQFDGQEFRFIKGVVINVPRNIGNGLLRSSGIIMGDHLTGEIMPALDKIGEYTLGEQMPEEKKSMTTCPVCDKDYKSFIRLSRHLAIAHKHDRADLYVEEVKEKGEGTDWEQDLEQLEAQTPAKNTAPKKKAGSAVLVIEEQDDDEIDGENDFDSDIAEGIKE